MAEAKYKNMWTFLIKSNYGNATDISTDMRCTICTRILINAHNALCGCRYCLECVKAYLNGERRFCPGIMDDCKTEELDIDSNIYPDHAMNYRISKLIVACRYSCGYRCEFRTMEEHERVCQKPSIDCSYDNVGGQETQSDTDKITKLMECIDRLECEIGSMKKETVELRLEMAEMSSARELDQVRARETIESVNQIHQEVANLRNENQWTKDENNFLKAEIDKYRTEYLESVAAVEQKLVDLRARSQRQDKHLQHMVENYLEINCQMRKERNVFRRIVDEESELRASELGDMKNRLLEIETNADTQNWGEFVWPIDEWAAKMQSAMNSIVTEIFSGTFYSHKNGYKMRLSVYPNGCGVARFSHLSVFFNIVPGPFDNILPWPFPGTVTLSIIDQFTGKDYDSATVSFDDLPNSLNWNKPTAQRKNKGIGFYDMINHLTLSTYLGLCQNDRIYIKCTVT